MDVIKRFVSVVNYLSADQSYHGITEICQEMRVSKASVYRILSSLEDLGWVVQDPETRKYKLGSALLEIGLSVLSHLDIRMVSLRYLNQLRDSINESAMLTLRVGFERIFIDQVQDNHEIRLIAELGKRYPLWSGAQGKVMLAHLEEREIEMIVDNLIESGIRVLASGQNLDIDGLRKELVEIRKQGFAVSVGERVIGASAVASPIFGQDNRVAGAISVGGPLHRFSVDKARECGPLVSQVAEKISLQLRGFNKLLFRSEEGVLKYDGHSV
jgi:DNA-binding IclR family transcriptional regulator